MDALIKYRTAFTMITLTAILSFLLLNPIMASGQDKNAVQTDEIAKQYVMPLLRAMQKGDKDGMYLNWIDSEHSKKTDAAFDQLIHLWDGRVAISAKRIGEKEQPAKGKTPSGITYSYEVLCSYDKVNVKVTITDATRKIDWINISATPEVTGTLSTWNRFNWAQWLITAAAALEILFSFVMAYCCVKRKPRLWGLWLAFILLMYGGITLSTLGGLSVGIYIYTLAFPKILDYQELGMKIYVSLPIGAIVYYMRFRHRELSEETER